MSEFDRLASLRRKIWDEPAVTLERAAELCGVSPRTLRRRLYLLESRRGPNRHIYVTVRSLEKFLLREQYSPSREFDIPRSLSHKPGSDDNGPEAT